MVRHIILWQLKDEYSEERKQEIRRGMKEGLESLQGKVPGLITMKVRIDGLASSSADAMLDAEFEDEAALKGYRVHPEHVKVADSRVRPFVKTRVCMDYDA